VKEKKQFYYTLIAILLIFISWIAFFVIPKFMEWRVLNKEMELYRIKNGLVVNMKKHAIELEEELKKLNVDTDQLREKMIPYTERNNIAKLIQEQFEVYNIQVVNISPVLNSFLSVNKNKGNTAFIRLPVEVELRSDFMAFTQLVQKIKSLPFYIIPDQLSIITTGIYDGSLLINFKVSLLISGNS